MRLRVAAGSYGLINGPELKSKAVILLHQRRSIDE